MDGVTVSVLGALVALAVAIVLILKKVQPTYAMLFGAVIGGLIGGAGLTGTVNYIISGTQGIVSAIIRIVIAGILAGALIGDYEQAGCKALPDCDYACNVDSDCRRCFR